VADQEPAYLIDDSEVRILFCSPDFRESAENARGPAHPLERVITIDGREYEDFLTADLDDEFDTAGTESDIALVIHSSGTTGRPKGVLLGRRALVAHAVCVGTKFPFTDGDRNLVAMPMFHVGGVCYALFGIRAGVRSIMTREPTPSR
jgi:acyl-CoA synthetase (AMP-forming)/AMP-acid ligase II